MNTKNMKNMVVIKNLPSNILEEAIVILKPNIKIKKLDLIENKNNSKKENIREEENKTYIINEAEMILENYISKIEKNKEAKPNKQIENKYKNLKIISILLTLMLMVSFFIK